MMGIRSMIAALAIASSAACISTSHAATPVAAKDYGVQVRHTELSRIQLDEGQQGIELTVTLANHGKRGLYDLRLYLLRAGPRMIAGQQEPARIRVLPAGAETVVTWTFETSDPVQERVRDALFRIEAVDQTTQEVVTFKQKSKEVG